ncbi:MAG: hemolysin family protein [Candidatus Omnitrophica bacterium]|nr:hemolysin family protein [Candidatus Omnitrophota bacterium]
MIFTYSLIIIFCMLVLNAWFAAYEMALASVSIVKLRGLAQENKRGAHDALFMKEKIEASFAAIQLCITLVGFIAAAVGGAGTTDILAPYLLQHFRISRLLADILSLIFFIIPLSAFTIIFGELVPKSFALKNREWVCLKLSPIMKSLYRVLFPVVSFFEGVVKLITETGSKKIGALGNYDLLNIHELKAIASKARASRVIGIREEKIVHSAAELSRRQVKDIIIPLSEISIIPVDSSLTQALIRAHTDMHSRFPVCLKDGDPQSITGYINFKDIIYTLHANPADPGLKAIVRPMASFAGSAKISVVMEEMIQGALHMALVTDGARKILGMVTLEDILEELVGEMLDEYDRLPTYIHPYGSGWIIAGGVPLDKVASVTGVTIPQSVAPGQAPVHTFAQWCRYIRKGDLRGAETFEEGRFIVTIRKFRRKEVLEAFVALSDKTNVA